MIIRKKTYERLIEQRNYWKNEFEMMKEDRDFHRELVKNLSKERDKYYSKYRKVLGSNGGYASNNNKLKEENKRLRDKLISYPIMDLCVEFNNKNNQKFNRNQKKNR